MFLGKLLRTGVVAAAVLAGLQLDASADPITFQILPSGVPTAGDLTTLSVYDNAKFADYWVFWATAGDNITVMVERVDGALDPAQWIYFGSYSDSADPGFTTNGITLGTGSEFIVFGDDEMAPAVPGPWGDPRSMFIAPTEGWYTVAVTSFLSGPVPGDGDYDYLITVRGNTGIPKYAPNPEPGTMILLSGALAAAGAWRRRRRAARVS